MVLSTTVACEVCGEQANFVMESYVDDEGQRIEWQKITIHVNGAYVTIHCPNCGEREQSIARACEDNGVEPSGQHD